MRSEIDMQEIANVMQCIIDHKQMANHFPQMGYGNEGSVDLKEYWETKIVKRSEKTWMDQSEFREWCEVDLHLISQMWGNTSGGWQGIGGSAMTNAYTTILENKWFNLSFVYYSGKLAYICEMDEKYLSCKEKNYRSLPGYNTCTEKLTVIFRKQYR